MTQPFDQSVLLFNHWRKARQTESSKEAGLFFLAEIRGTNISEGLVDLFCFDIMTSRYLYGWLPVTDGGMAVPWSGRVGSGQCGSESLQA